MTKIIHHRNYKISIDFCCIGFFLNWVLPHECELIGDSFYCNHKQIFFCPECGKDITHIDNREK